ncbi:hypothetical protein AB8810_11080 [Xanthomonas sp. NCPPB 3005]|uniref:hypothetical protein n=1 Tax=Xanthomonas sp. NCPPB 3005 TaxID=3240913 RepID=UPI0035115CA2
MQNAYRRTPSRHGRIQWRIVVDQGPQSEDAVVQVRYSCGDGDRVSRTPIPGGGQLSRKELYLIVRQARSSLLAAATA